MRQATLTAEDVIARLALEPHPEGGYFRETWRAAAASGARAAGTAIYYLLRAGERSHWHRVDADELWHFYAGAPLVLGLSRDGSGAEQITLGPNITDGARPQALVPTGVWQSARTLGDWTLVGCTVVPGFEFAGFELAPPDWSPGGQGTSAIR